MKRKVLLVEIDKLRIHEKVDKSRVDELAGRIKNDGFLRNPVVVDSKTLVVLDGHHRLSALRRLNLKKIPVMLVDYLNGEVKVYLRRKELMMDLVKEAVLNRALRGEVFPIKTTRHLIKNRIRNRRVILDDLS